MVSGKSANQLWKEMRASGETSLDFKSWLIREKEKGFLNYDGAAVIPVNKTLNTSIQDTLQKMHIEAGYKTDANDKYILGINKNVLLWTGVGVGVLIAAIIVIKKMS